MYVWIKHADGRSREVPVRPGVHWLGNDASCDVRIPGSGVSSRHARLDLASDGKFGVVDLGGMSGTRVNGERVVTAGPLDRRDVLHIGECELRVVTDEESLKRSDVGSAKKNGSSTGSANLHSDSARPPSKSHEPQLPSVPHGPPVPPVPHVPLESHEPLPNAQGAGPVSGDGILRAAAVLHQQLLAQLDLRRRDVASMPDAALRALARNILQPLVASWSVKAGCTADQLLEFVLHESLGLGPLEALLADDAVREIMINGPDTLFVEREGRIERVTARFSGESALRGIIERIVAPLGRRVDEASPMVDARLPDGSRVNVVLAPLAVRGTAVTIRRFGRRRLTADGLIRSGSLNQDMLDFLEVCVLQRRNIVVSGGTGSGKTTLLNILSALIPRHERIVTIEDSAELSLDHPNLISLETRPPNLEGRGEITVRDLVRNALRMRPDRIVVGECRGGETLDMLQAMNTGHDGSMSTVHANSPRELLSRLEVMVLMSGVDLPVTAIREQIASSVHVIVHQSRSAAGNRRVTHITEVTGLVSGTIQTQDIFRYAAAVTSTNEVGGFFEASGHVPQFYEDLARTGMRMDFTPFRPKCGEGVIHG